jgi:flagellar biosynthesis/type III secretory pathway protein FliH
VDVADEARTLARGSGSRALRIPAEVWEARLSARSLREHAAEEAGRIRSAAEEEAGRVRAGAARDAEGARRTALEEGRAEGRAEGLASAAAEVLRGARARERLLADGASLALELAVAMAGRILEREVRAGEDAATAARQALTLLGDEARVVLRASPIDLPELEAGWPRGWPGDRVRIVGDPALAVGEVVVESGHSLVDGTFRARLALLRRALDGEE